MYQIILFFLGIIEIYHIVVYYTLHFVLSLHHIALHYFIEVHYAILSYIRLYDIGFDSKKNTFTI